jgi:putative redox protein
VEEPVSGETEKLTRFLGEYKTKVAPEMKMRLEWEKDLIFAARTSTGYVFDFDAKVEWGCMPTESMLASIGSCLAIDVVSFVTKMRGEITDFKMDMTAKRNPVPPQYFKEVDLLITVKGRNLDQRKMDRAVNLSKEKYCSVYHTLRQDLKHTVRYKIIDEEG